MNKTLKFLILSAMIGMVISTPRVVYSMEGSRELMGENPPSAIPLKKGTDGQVRPLLEVGDDDVPQEVKVVCDRLNLEEHRQLASESDVRLIKKNLSDGDLKALLPLMQSNPSLTKLDLFRNNIGAKGAVILSSLPRLRTLNLEENNIVDEEAAAFETNTTLKALNLFKNGITDLGVIPLARNTTLQELGLYSNQISDLGAFALSVNRSLRKLDLRRNQIGDKGTQALAVNQTLQIIFLGRNAITDEGAKAFLDKENFVHVDLKDTRVSAEAVQLFEQAFSHNGFLIRMRHHIVPRLMPGLPFSDLLPLFNETVFLLSVDGGGIRGLIPSLVLEHLERKLTHQLGRPVALAKGFDWMAGTSTGGLIALGLNAPHKDDATQPQYPVSELVKLYQERGPVIFPKPWGLGLFKSTYDPKPMESLLRDYFGEAYLSQTIGHVLITAFNMGEDASHVFDTLEARHNPEEDFLIRFTARATSAAPTYFPAAEVTNRIHRKYTFIDGGVYANNPTVIGIQRIQELYPHAKKIVVLSLGTGEGVADRTMTQLGNAGKLGWAPKIADHLMKNAAKVAQESIASLIQQDSRLEYMRIQAIVDGSEKKMDNVSKENIQALINVGQATIRSHEREINQIVTALMKKFSSMARH